MGRTWPCCPIWSPSEHPQLSTLQTKFESPTWFGASNAGYETDQDIACHVPTKYWTVMPTSFPSRTGTLKRMNLATAYSSLVGFPSSSYKRHIFEEHFPTNVWLFITIFKIQSTIAFPSQIIIVLVAIVEPRENSVDRTDLLLSKYFEFSPRSRPRISATPTDF